MTEKVKIEFDLPWPPSCDLYWRLVRKQVKVSTKARLFRSHVIDLVQSWQTKRIEGALRVSILANPPHLRPTAKVPHKIHNLIQIIFDALEAADVIRKDQQINLIQIERSSIIKKGSLRIRLEEALA